MKSYFLSTISYFAESQLTVTILHFCMRAALTPSTVADQTYYVTDTPLSVAFPTWTSSIPTCGPTKFTAKLQSGGGLPSFIKVTPSGITVLTPNPGDVKKYSLQFVAIPPNGYNPSTSTITVDFKVDVKCVVKKI